MYNSHLLVFPEVCLDGDGDGIVLQFTGVQELHAPGTVFASPSALPGRASLGDSPLPTGDAEAGKNNMSTKSMKRCA